MVAPGIFINAASARGNADHLHLSRGLVAQRAGAVQAIEHQAIASRDLNDLLEIGNDAGDGITQLGDVLRAEIARHPAWQQRATQESVTGKTPV